MTKGSQNIPPMDTSSPIIIHGEFNQNMSNNPNVQFINLGLIPVCIRTIQGNYLIQDLPYNVSKYTVNIVQKGGNLTQGKQIIVQTISKGQNISDIQIVVKDMENNFIDLNGNLFIQIFLQNN